MDEKKKKKAAIENKVLPMIEDVLQRTVTEQKLENSLPDFSCLTQKH